MDLLRLKTVPTARRAHMVRELGCPSVQTAPVMQRHSPEATSWWIASAWQDSKASQETTVCSAEKGNTNPCRVKLNVSNAQQAHTIRISGQYHWTIAQIVRQISIAMCPRLHFAQSAPLFQACRQCHRQELLTDKTANVHRGILGLWHLTLAKHVIPESSRLCQARIIANHVH